MVRPVVVLLFLAAIAAGDVLVLTDGTRLEGQIRKSADGWTVNLPDGTIRTVPASRVARVEITGGAEASAADKLASLMRAVEPLNDIDQIIQRFQRFAEANPNTAAAEEALAEAELWTRRKAQGLVKVGSRWMTPGEHAALVESIHPQIEQARELLRTGRRGEAEPVVAQVLALDPRHISALYLQGVILFEQDKPPQARRAFEQVNEQIEEHAPTLNNLAVIHLRQNQFGPAMNLFDQAMVAAPADRTILDNVAEALGATRDDQRRMPVVSRVSRRFAEQDATLAAQLKEKDLYRWGATWVNKKQLDQLIAAEQAIEQKIRQFKTDFELLSGQVVALERQIEEADRTIQRIEQESWFIDVNGRWVRRPLPTYYFDEVRRRDQLMSDRVRAVAQQKALREQAERVKQDLPVPRYTGTWKLIGEEGTPVEPPATQPSG